MGEQATRRYRQARDELLALTGRHTEAVASFRWPDLGGEFNWAVDWFDAVARDNDRPALVVVEEDGRSQTGQLRRDGAPIGPGGALARRAGRRAR